MYESANRLPVKEGEEVHFTYCNALMSGYVRRLYRACMDSYDPGGLPTDMAVLEDEDGDWITNMACRNLYHVYTSLITGVGTESPTGLVTSTPDWSLTVTSWGPYNFNVPFIVFVNANNAVEDVEDAESVFIVDDETMLNQRIEALMDAIDVDVLYMYNGSKQFVVERPQLFIIKEVSR